MLLNKNQHEFISRNESKKFLDLINKYDKEKPDSKNLQEIEIMLNNNPSLWQIGIGYAGNILEQFIDKLFSNQAHQLVLKAEVISIKENLGYSSSTQLERLIIDQIMFCWVGMNYAEGRMHGLLTNGNYPLKIGEYWQKNLIRYQNRYLKAIETLARISRLNKSTVFQVNIATDGGKQINVTR